LETTVFSNNARVRSTKLHLLDKRQHKDSFLHILWMKKQIFQFI